MKKQTLIILLLLISCSSPVPSADPASEKAAFEFMIRFLMFYCNDKELNTPCDYEKINIELQMFDKYDHMDVFHFKYRFFVFAHGFPALRFNSQILARNFPISFLLCTRNQHRGLR